MSELSDLASRLALTYSRSKQLEEFRYPGLASQAQKMVVQDPEQYARIASALMDGSEIQRIAKVNHVTREFVRFVRQMHPELQSIARAQLVNHLEEASIAMATRLVDEANDIPIDKVPTALSVTLDKLALLTGGITARVEHTSAPKPEDVQRMFEALPKVEGQQS